MVEEVETTEQTVEAGSNRSLTVMTVEDLAAFLQVSPKSVYKMAAAGECPAAKVAGQWRFYRPMIERWLVTLSRQDYKGPALAEPEEEGNADL